MNIVTHHEIGLQLSVFVFMCGLCEEELMCVSALKGILVTMVINSAHAVCVAMETETKTSRVPSCCSDYQSLMFSG